MPSRPLDDRSASLVPASSPSVRVAVGLVIPAAVLLAVGGVLPVVEGASPGFSSAVLLVLLAVIPSAVAVVLLLCGRWALASGVVAGLATLAPGRMLLDLQFAVDAALVSRPALYKPDTLSSPEPAAGLWLLLAGQAVLAVAGLVATRSGAAQEGAAGTSDGQAPSRQGTSRLLLIASCSAVLASIGLLMAPFTSTDAYLLARGVFGTSGLMLIGSLLLACAVPLVAAVVTSSGATPFARGCLAGLGLAVLTVSLPDLVAVMSMARLGLSAGPVVAAIGALALLGLARGHGARAVQLDEQAEGAAAARVPSRRKLEVGTGVLAVLTAVAALVASMTPLVTFTEPLPGVDHPTRWSLLAAGVLTGMVGGLLLRRRLAALLRPAVSVIWVAVLIAGTSALGLGIAAGETGGVATPGPGVLWTVLAMSLATATGCVSAVTGLVEREDTPRAASGARVVAAVAVAGVLAGAGFVLPVVSSADYVAPGLVGDLATSSWGLLAGLIAVGSAAALTPYSRPLPAAAMLGGAACLQVLHLAQWPLLGGRVAGLHPGPGWWFTLAGLVLLLGVAGVQVAAARRERPAVAV